MEEIEIPGANWIHLSSVHGGLGPQWHGHRLVCFLQAQELEWGDNEKASAYLLESDGGPRQLLLVQGNPAEALAKAQRGWKGNAARESKISVYLGDDSREYEAPSEEGEENELWLRYDTFPDMPLMIRGQFSFPALPTLKGEWTLVLAYGELDRLRDIQTSPCNQVPRSKPEQA